MVFKNLKSIMFRLYPSYTFSQAKSNKLAKNQENDYNFHYVFLHIFVREYGFSLIRICPYKDKHIMHEKDKIKYFRLHKVTQKRIETNSSFFMKPFTCSKSFMKTTNKYVKYV